LLISVLRLLGKEGLIYEGQLICQDIRLHMDTEKYPYCLRPYKPVFLK